MKLKNLTFDSVETAETAELGVAEKRLIVLRRILSRRALALRSSCIGAEKVFGSIEFELQEGLNWEG